MACGNTLAHQPLASRAHTLPWPITIRPPAVAISCCLSMQCMCVPIAAIVPFARTTLYIVELQACLQCALLRFEVSEPNLWR